MDTKEAVARFIIDQVIECPHCQREFSVVAAIKAGKLPPKTITVSQAVHEKADVTTQRKEITVEIPRPYYFGALMQYTKFEPGNEEHIDCTLCNKPIRVPFVDFDYSIIASNDRSNWGQRLLRRMFPRRPQSHRDQNYDS